MSLYYTHLLIPERPDFIPQPQQIVAFLEGVVELGSAPLEPKLKLGTPAAPRIGRNPATGETLSIPTRAFVAFPGIADAAQQLVGLNDYDLIMEGQGPPPLPPFKLYSADAPGVTEWTGSYAYEISCCLRKEPVSLSQTAPTGKLHSSKSRIPPDPSAAESTKESAKAASARFWIRFRFGKWLIPNIGKDVDLLQPSILKTTIKHFGLPFAQSCMWV